jgi:excisionase family DNA binding protein
MAEVIALKEKYLTTLEVAAMLSWSQYTLYRWLRDGHWPRECAPIRLAGRRYVFPKAQFIEWRAQVMTVEEASELWGLPPTAIRCWAREGVLPLTCGKIPGYYMFSRDALTQQRERWLSDRELVALSGVTEEAVRQWAREGLQSPVACPHTSVGQPHYWFLRADVLHLRAKPASS